jgi:hypothetical protein
MSEHLREQALKELELFTKLTKKAVGYDVPDQLLNIGGTIFKTAISARQNKKDQLQSPVKTAFKNTSSTILDKLNPFPERKAITNNTNKIKQIINIAPIAELNNVKSMLSQANNAIVTQLTTKKTNIVLGAVSKIPALKILAKLTTMATSELLEKKLNKATPEHSHFNTPDSNIEIKSLIHSTMCDCFLHEGNGADNKSVNTFIENIGPEKKVLETAFNIEVVKIIPEAPILTPAL